MGYVGKRPALEVLIKGLRRLEYRGYDSTGVAFFEGGHIQIRKSEGRLENTEKLLAQSATNRDVTCGIGHTRWATHGKPTTTNAHPHQAGHVVLVHNGIIENYLEIKDELLKRGHRPQSETDSELFGFLVLEHMDSGASLIEAVRLSFLRLEGQCSVVVMSEREPGVVVGVRNGSPLVAARDPQGGGMIASDAQPLIEYSRDVVFLEHGDMVVASREGLKFFSLENGKPSEVRSTHLDWSVERLDKQGFAHYMLKEIHEQPTSIVDTLNGLLDRSQGEAFRLADQPGVKILEQAKGLTLVACGTSYYACLTAKYWLEQWARVPVQVELASEYRYGEPVLSSGHVVVGVSQSGETADTLAVLRDLRMKGIPTLGIANVRGCSMAREATAIFYTSAGPEIGVAATKSFTTQLVTLLTLAGHLGVHRKVLTEESARKAFDDALRLPHLLGHWLTPDSRIVGQIREVARALHQAKGFFFIGRGTSYPIALEGALKLKEIAYVHAEGYAAGELKHGPIAMIDKEMVVVVLAPRDAWREKTVSNLEEVKARGARILGIGDETDERLKSLCDHWVGIPTEGIMPNLFPFLTAPAVQLLSYEIALLKGTDVDKPRNLAKSVTVE